MNKIRVYNLHGVVLRTIKLIYMKNFENVLQFLLFYQSLNAENSPDNIKKDGSRNKKLFYYFFKYFIYSAAQDLSCSKRDL